MKIKKVNSTVTAAKATNSNQYEAAMSHIEAAINLLGTNAKENIVAKESIANLGVVLFDLKGTNK